MLSFERAGTSRSVGWWSLLGILLVPLLVAAGFLWATWNSDTRLTRVQAAVVNLDQPVTIKGHLVPLGRQLAGGLVKGDAQRPDQNFTWVLTDSDDARTGLASGTYAAVVTIPENFSASATSFSKTSAADILPATIDVQTSEVRGIADSAIAQAITTTARSTLNSTLTQQYLNNVYLGFNATGKQVRTVADAAGKLADGTVQLTDGLHGTAAGSSRLAGGLGQLRGGAEQLASGADQLSSGTGALSTGLTKLSDGASGLPTQVGRLASGARQAADGSQQLASGVQQLAAGAERLDRGVPAHRGAPAQPGFARYATGVNQFAAGVQGYTALGAGVDSGLRTYATSMNSFSSLAPQQLARAVPCPFGKDPSTPQCQGFYAGFVGGTQAAYSGLTAKQDVRGRQLSLLDLSGQLSSSGAQLDRAATGIAKGASGFAAGVHQLAAGTATLAARVNALPSGLNQLAEGTANLAAGMIPLSAGIDQAAAGSVKLASGASSLARGAHQLAGGAGQSASGAGQLSDGLVKLAAGGDQLADGSRKLADGLAKGAHSVPTYDSATRGQLSSVVATPVRANPADSLFQDVANTTFLAVLALWLGGLTSYLVLRAVPSRVLSSSRPSWRLAAEALAPGAVIAALQALALSLVLQRLLDLGGGELARLLPLALLASLAFVALNYALVAWFGGVGRFVSVVAAVLFAAAAITSAVPAFFDALRPFLPMTPALAGFRAAVTDGPGLGAAMAALLGWLMLGVAAGVMAVSRQRLASPLAAAVPAG